MNILLNNFTNFRINNTKNEAYTQRFGISCPNLAPLKQDTVSFSGRSELIAKDMSNAPSENICNKVSQNAEPAEFYLQAVLNKYVAPYMRSQSNGNNALKYPVASITTRRKSPASIREKVVSKYTKTTDFLSKDKGNAANYNPEDYPLPNSIKGIKHYAKDIVGARIIMKTAGPQYASPIISALKKAAEDGALHITSIENNIPAPEKLPKNKTLANYIYATNGQLKSLAKAANAELIENKSPSGYLAIHINVDLDNPVFDNYKGTYGGYSGEIQIIGADVERLKDIEDICYKLKDNKNAVHIAYQPFKDHFNKYYKGKTKKAFDAYTYALYLAQRDIPPSSRKKTIFPSIKELGFQNRVPEELDFNNLRVLKESCDSVLRNMQQQKELEEFNGINEPKKNANKIKNEGDIKTMKSLISYTLSNQI